MNDTSCRSGRLFRGLILQLAIFLCVSRRSTASTAAFPVTHVVRGGAGPKSSWTASPLGIRRRQTQHQREKTTRYPVVRDLDAEDATPEEAKEMLNAFLTRDSRNTFISRVYAILAGQLLVTALSILAFGLNPTLSGWIKDKGAFVPGISIILSTIAWFVICISPRARREAPMKWQLLSLFTVCEAIAVGFISSFYKFQTVMTSMFATCVATLSVSIYTLMQRNPKYDLSQWGMTLSSLGMIFLVYGLINLLEVMGVLPAGFLPYRESLYSLLGATLFSFYLAYHTKLIVGGKNTKYQMNEKDYVFGAMALYSDVLNLFIYILRLLGDDDSSR